MTARLSRVEGDGRTEHPSSPPGESLDDGALLRRTAEGCQPAFETLHRRYYPRLFRFVLRVTRRPDLTDEIINDTMLAVWRSAGSFAGRSKASTWIMGIAYNRALKALGREGRGPAWVEEEKGYAVADPACLEDAIAAIQEGDRLKQALAQLSPAHRAVIELTYFHGYTCSESAALLGCPVDTVKTRMFHARARLRTLLTTPGTAAREKK